MIGVLGIEAGETDVPGMPKPISASVPISIIAQVIVIGLRTPPMCRMSCS